MRLGIFGGTFNPVHYGHLRVAEEARFKNALDKVIFIPSGSPPIKTSELADASLRYLMTRLATASNPDFILSDIELRQTGKSYTVNTIQRLREIYTGDELFLILGIDAFLDMAVWRQPEKIISIVDFIVVTRPGFDIPDVFKSPYIVQEPAFSANIKEKSQEFFATKSYKVSFRLISGRSLTLLNITPIGISSTDIRGLVMDGKSIKYLLPEKVERFIYEHNIYGEKKIV